MTLILRCISSPRRSWSYIRWNLKKCSSGKIYPHLCLFFFFALSKGPIEIRLINVCVCMWAWSFDRKEGPFLCMLRERWHTHTREARRANICQSIFHARAQRFRFMCCPIPPLSRRRSFHHVKSLVEWVGSEVAQTFDPIRLLFFPHTTVNTNVSFEKMFWVKSYRFRALG